MRTKTKQNLLYAGAALASSVLLFNVAKKKKEKDGEKVNVKGKEKDYWVYEDHDLRNSNEADREEAPDANTEEGKKGLSELDAAHYDEWQSIGYPSTRREIEDVEKTKE